MHITIGTTVVEIPLRFKAGDPMDDDMADVLNYILHKRVMGVVRRAYGKGELAPNELQDRANALCAVPMTTATALDDMDDDIHDPIMVEALAMACGLITAHMATKGLPAPRNIDDHARELVRGRPDLYERARLRHVTRLGVAAEALKGLS